MVESNSCRFCCGSGLAIVGGISGLNTSVGGGSVCLGSGIIRVACGSNGASSKDPSAKQKVKVSSKVRLHVGQLFIWLLT